MTFDASTLFVVIVTTALANAVLLLWSWLQNRRENMLLAVAIGYASTAAGNVLLAARDSAPAFVTIDLANALVIYSMGMVWVATRTFNRRPAPQWVPLIGIAVWLAALRVPAIAQAYELRVVVAAVISAFFCFIGARELWVRDGLRSRFPLAVLLVFHAMVILARIPVSMGGPGTVEQFQGSWFGPLALEALVFVQLVALLVLSLTKERAESRLHEAAMTDPLTGLANRRAFFEHGARLVAEAQRSEQADGADRLRSRPLQAGERYLRPSVWRRRSGSLCRGRQVRPASRVTSPAALAARSLPPFCRGRPKAKRARPPSAL